MTLLSNKKNISKESLGRPNCHELYRYFFKICHFAKVCHLVHTGDEGEQREYWPSLTTTLVNALSLAGGLCGGHANTKPLHDAGLVPILDQRRVNASRLRAGLCGADDTRTSLLSFLQ